MFIDDFDSLWRLIPMLKRVETSIPSEQFGDEIFASDGSVKFGTTSWQWPHREALHIVLRGVTKEMIAEKGGFEGNVTKAIDTYTYAHYPKIKQWVNDFALRSNAQVQRVMIAALAPEHRVYRHADRGYYFAPRDRYHLVLHSEGGTMRIAGQEEILRQGEVWWINNKAAHESFNNSDTVRVHLIVDLLPNSMFRRIKNYLRWIYLGLRPNRLTNYYFNWPKRNRATS